MSVQVWANAVPNSNKFRLEARVCGLDGGEPRTAIGLGGHVELSAWFALTLKFRLTPSRLLDILLNGSDIGSIISGSFPSGPSLSLTVLSENDSPDVSASTIGYLGKLTLFQGEITSDSLDIVDIPGCIPEYPPEIAHRIPVMKIEPLRTARDVRGCLSVRVLLSKW
jgi:hypothetical protein